MAGSTERISPELTSSPVYRVRGMRSAYQYPNERLTPEYTSEMYNVNISEMGTAVIANGYSLYNATQLSGAEHVTGFVQTELTTGTWQLVVTPTKIYIDNGTTRTNVTGALTLNGGNDDRTRFVNIRDQIVGNNSVNATWTKDNDFTTPTNAAALGGVLWTKAIDIMPHQGLLLVLGPTESGVAYTTRVRWCNVNRQTFVPDITVWGATDRYEIYEGGTPIIGGVDNFGYALIFKSDGLYPGKIKYSVGFLEFVLGDPIRGFSPVAKHSFVARPEFVFGVASEGAFIIRPDLSFELVTREVQDQWDSLNQGRLQYAVSWVREKDHQIRTLLSSSSNSSGHNRVMVYEWDTGDVWFDRPTNNISYGARVVLSNAELELLGSTAGYLFKNNVANVYTHNGTAFPWKITMLPNDVGLPGISKKFVTLKTYSRYIAGQSSVTLNVKLNQGNLATRTSTITMSQGYTYNSGRTYNSGLRYPSGNFQVDSFFINRDAETVAPEWTASVPANITGYSVEYQVLEG